MSGYKSSPSIIKKYAVIPLFGTTLSAPYTIIAAPGVGRWINVISVIVNNLSYSPAATQMYFGYPSFNFGVTDMPPIHSVSTGINAMASPGQSINDLDNMPFIAYEDDGGEIGSLGVTVFYSIELTGR